LVRFVSALKRLKAAHSSSAQSVPDGGHVFNWCKVFTNTFLWSPGASILRKTFPAVRASPCASIDTNRDGPAWMLSRHHHASVEQHLKQRQRINPSRPMEQRWELSRNGPKAAPRALCCGTEADPAPPLRSGPVSSSTWAQLLQRTPGNRSARWEAPAFPPFTDHLQCHRTAGRQQLAAITSAPAQTAQLPPGGSADQADSSRPHPPTRSAPHRMLLRPRSGINSPAAELARSHPG